MVSAIDLNSSDVTNTLTVTNGGTGANTLTAGGVIVGNGTAAVTSVTASGAGQCLISTGGNPSFQACPGSTSGVDTINALNGAVTLQGTLHQISVNTGMGAITLSTPQDIDDLASPTFTGLTLSSLSAGGVVKAANGTGALSTGQVALGSDGRTGSRRRAARPPPPPAAAGHARRLGLLRPVRSPVRRLPADPDPGLVRAVVHQLRHRQHPELGHRRVRRPGQLLQAAARRPVPEVGPQHGLLRRRRRPLHRGRGAAAGQRAQPGHREAARAVPRRLLPAGGHEHRGIAVIWRYLLEPDVGLLNTLLGKIGIDGPNWLGNPNTTMPSIIALGVWRNVGTAMVIFLAALQTVDPALYDAARVDGARGVQVFRHITVPMLKPAILFVSVITSIGYLQVFEEPFVLTGPRGGTQQSAFTTSMHVYQQGFGFFNLGYASAVAYALFTAIVVLAIIQFRFLRSET